MKAVKLAVAMAVSGVAFASYPACGIEQQVTGALGTASATTTIGGVVPTPALDRIARSGLRYTNFHSTALCSPTRAAIITGRNHHSNTFGVVGEIAAGFPGCDSIIRKGNSPIGKILEENGYATSSFGRDHSVAFFQNSQANTTQETQS